MHLIGHGVGPIPTRVMVVGEAWGEQEDLQKEPFVGTSGAELNKMLHEAGILRTECFVTNLVNARPPGNDLGAWMALKKKDITPQHVPLRDKMVLPIVREGYERLLTEINACQPNVIIACGNAAMWALTGNWGILKWRGSLLTLNTPGQNGLPPKVIPTVHPAAVLRQWSLRAPAVRDLRRAAGEMTSRELVRPNWRFITKPSFQQVQETLTCLLDTLDGGSQLWLDFDLETRLGHISCVGISWSESDAICIPFMYSGRRDGYWSPEEEAWIVWTLRKIALHPRAKTRWQNGLYDAQYTYRHWHFVPRGYQDTMIAHHSIFSDLPKALAFQASMYSPFYIYWKDEGKDFNTGGRDEEKGWVYNCQDCWYTRMVGEVEESTAKSLGLNKPYAFQQSMFYPVLRAMLRGIRVLEDNARTLAEHVDEAHSARETFLQAVLGHPININSPKQLQALFYDDLKQPVIMSRPKKGSPAHVTCDDEALKKLGTREPLLRPIVNCIADMRTLEGFQDFIHMKRDQDGRMRCSFNIGGSESGKSAPKTFRLSSSKSAFDSGGNLQTIPSEKSKSVGKALARQHFSMVGDPVHLPNLRTLYGPDAHKTIFDMDLNRADLFAMAWDAEDSVLKEVLARGVDTHLFNAFVLANREPPPLDELVEGHPKYPDHRAPLKTKREFAKVFCHATDYLGKARTVAAACGVTVHEADRSQKIYLGMYKGIEKWQQRTIEEVKKRRYVENIFGYRWYIFDRIDDQVMPEAVAWKPQSTVSIVINRIWMSLFQNAPEGEWELSVDHLMKLLHHPNPYLEVLLQVHDSLVGQFPTCLKDKMVARIQELSRIVVPFSDPLIIPTGIATSEISWGDVE